MIEGRDDTVASEEGPNPTLEALPPGYRIGRFVILYRLGVGGMGVVYAAYDRELDRKLGIKVLRTHLGASPGARVRMTREAQALARVDHPNVLAVHDVGVHDERIFIATAFVDGTTLREWLAKRPRSRRDVLEVFLQAGRGLAAAHAAGLIHRDFKPDNVLVDKTDRALVTDFGLVRAAGPSEPEAADVTALVAPDVGLARTVPDSDHLAVDASNARALESPLTMAGSVVGTPAYMAPEQHRGKPADARSDQFAFCTALWEALCGERPFAAATRDDLIEEIEAGRARGVDRVPRRLRRVLLRGLASDPAGRHASMPALLRALRDEPQAWRRAALAALLVASIGVAAWAVLRSAPAAPPSCAAAVAPFAGVWNDGASRAIHTAFAATGDLSADHAARTVDHVLDEYQRAWGGVATGVCTAARSGAIPGLALDRRGRCLARRLGELGALVNVLSSGPGREVVDRAVAAARALTPVLTCEDDDALASAVAPPENPEVRAQVDRLRERLDRAEALVRTGGYQQALTAAESLTVDARAVGHRAFLAEALILHARALTALVDPRAVEVVREAIEMAASAGDDRTLARAWLHLLHSLVVDNRFAEAVALELAASAAVTRAGNDPLLRAALLNSVGRMHYEQGNYALARTTWREVLTLRLANLDPNNPEVANAWLVIGNAALDQSDLEDARAHYEHALAIYERSQGPDHPNVGVALSNIAAVLHTQGDLGEARRYYQRSLELVERRTPNLPDHAVALNALANLDLEEGAVADARRRAEQALAIAERTLGVGHQVNINAVLVLAAVAAKQGHGDAESLYLRALQATEAARGAQNPQLAYPLFSLAEVLVDAGRPIEARPLLERALAVCAAECPDPTWLAHIHFDLARLVWSTDRRRARDLIRSARATLATIPRRDAALHRDVEQWLAAHGGP